MRESASNELLRDPIPQEEMKEPSDTAAPGFWDERYASGETPWVARAVPAALHSFLLRTQPRGKVLIPGCGTDHQVIRVFAAAGFDVTAIDFSAVAVAKTRDALNDLKSTVLLADFFEYDFATKFDFVFERTFLCALPTTRWKEYANRLAQLLRPGGKLIGVFFYGVEPEPPPHPLNDEQALNLFGKSFRLIRSEEISDSVAMFSGMERWQEWQLRTDAKLRK